MVSWQRDMRHTTGIAVEGERLVYPESFIFIGNILFLKSGWHMTIYTFACMLNMFK